MRLCDVMTPARSREEAALLTAQTRTVSGGAALRSVQRTDWDREVVEIENTAGQDDTVNGSCACRRAALRHLLERQF